MIHDGSAISALLILGSQGDHRSKTLEGLRFQNRTEPTGDEHRQKWQPIRALSDPYVLCACRRPTMAWLPPRQVPGTSGVRRQQPINTGKGTLTSHFEFLGIVDFA
ncbi:hypothetical protein P170DRAFT_475548 [Aspergillus steynii IBT 23096]|uniref:Uncharacterized protein n=1 Tax=Aspergillus steynii IBT 23096 TaxID=1392250 RepID=A0A2I2G8P1_9EURO|nr:uncharacterized protein P170DRAFT_475548 [Aspergillus steynii IBT 23096]PLB49245.1 hypothetical protein P170DRAFT_475548 [Aspergillus steynii IBT 23096]